MWSEAPSPMMDEKPTRVEGGRECTLHCAKRAKELEDLWGNPKEQRACREGGVRKKKGTATKTW